MFRKIVSILLTALLAVSLMPAHAQQTVTVTDMYGREITLTAPATRIIALTAADCEILCALGGESLLVARGEYCDYPESILSLPVVQSGADTNIEEIIAYAPQVVLMSDMAQSKEQVDLLERSGIQVVVSNAKTLAETFTAIRMIGQLIGHDAQAEALILDMQTAFEGIAALSQNTGKTVYFEVSPLQWGLWTAGTGTFMDELAALCGLTNAFADVKEYDMISPEQVLARNPDYIVTITQYYPEFDPMTPVEEIASRAGWENLTAVEENHILNADSNSISRPGPRLVEAVMELFTFVYGTDALSPAA